MSYIAPFRHSKLCYDKNGQMWRHNTFISWTNIFSHVSTSIFVVFNTTKTSTQYPLGCHRIKLISVQILYYKRTFRNNISYYYYVITRIIPMFGVRGNCNASDHARSNRYPMRRKCSAALLTDAPNTRHM